MLPRCAAGGLCARASFERAGAEGTWGPIWKTITSLGHQNEKGSKHKGDDHNPNNPSHQNPSLQSKTVTLELSYCVSIIILAENIRVQWGFESLNACSNTPPKEQLQKQTESKPANSHSIPVVWRPFPADCNRSSHSNISNPDFHPTFFSPAWIPSPC